MAPLEGIRPPYRWLAGLLLLSLPRRFIAGRLRDLAASCPDKLIPYPVGNAHAGQLRRLSYQFLMLGSDPDVQGRRMTTLRGSLFHGDSVLPQAGQVKECGFSKTLDVCIAIGYTAFTVETEQMDSPITSPVACRYCGGPTLGWGRDRSGNARRFCKACKKSFGLIPERPLGTMRISMDKATLCVSLLTEGSSIRSIERVSGIHRDTICRLLRLVGGKCDRIMNTLVRGVAVADVQADEIWSYVGKKEATKARQRDYSPETGDAYTWLAMEANSKLILTHHVGRRTSEDANVFMARVAAATAGEFQISTDSLAAYPAAVERHLGGRVDYAQIKKIFAGGVDGEHRYSPPSIIGIEKTVISGNPKEERACTSHIERQNLDVRMRSRRFTRLTNAFSKKRENLKAAVSLWVAAQNFCHMNRTLRMTPAMAAGIVRKPWSVRELLVN